MSSQRVIIAQLQQERNISPENHRRCIIYTIHRNWFHDQNFPKKIFLLLFLTCLSLLLTMAVKYRLWRKKKCFSVLDWLYALRRIPTEDKIWVGTILKHLIVIVRVLISSCWFVVQYFRHLNIQIFIYLYKLQTNWKR